MKKWKCGEGRLRLFGQFLSVHEVRACGSALGSRNLCWPDFIIYAIGGHPLSVRVRLVIDQLLAYYTFMGPTDGLTHVEIDLSMVETPQ